MMKRTIFYILLFISLTSCLSFKDNKDTPSWLLDSVSSDSENVYYSYYTESLYKDNYYIISAIESVYVDMCKSLGYKNLNVIPLSIETYIKYIIEQVILSSDLFYGTISDEVKFYNKGSLIYAIRLKFPKDKLDEIENNIEHYFDFTTSYKSDLKPITKEFSSNSSYDTVFRNKSYIDFIFDNSILNYYSCTEIMIINAFSIIDRLSLVSNRYDITEKLGANENKIVVNIINEITEEMIDLDIAAKYWGLDSKGDKVYIRNFDVDKKQVYSKTDFNIQFPIPMWLGEDKIEVQVNDMQLVDTPLFGLRYTELFNNIKESVEKLNLVINRKISPSSRNYKIGVIVDDYDIAKNKTDSLLTGSTIVDNLFDSKLNVKLYSTKESARKAKCDVYIIGRTDILSYEKEAFDIKIEIKCTVNVALWNKKDYNFFVTESIGGQNLDILYPLGYKIVGKQVAEILLNNLP